ncbi:transmembrane protein UsgS [Talaromyces marneffei ATCC 18224]|uniref:Transmembrane protein UsgS n=1 Tax=Talaromyces marneffei (strain ATCC 18224 / CBS 334.59 / QM 7333) TaxID=441960 RepID=B6QEL7_TALMQ|nr:transmembrane protein UsgS [Talaromyces marneffei ATCC 18224]
MSQFEPNAILRGAQLTVVGTVRILRNPELFKHDHFRQAALAVLIGVVIHLILQIPMIIIKLALQIASLVVELDSATWDDKLIGGLNFVSNSVLQVPFLLMTLMRYITPTLDDIFLLSLKWVDATYVEKHKTDDPRNTRAMYYPNLVKYRTKRSGSPSTPRKPINIALIAFLNRYARRVGMWLGIYVLSLLPVVGRFVMPAASFYSVRKSLGTTPAAVIFGSGLVLPKSLTPISPVSDLTRSKNEDGSSTGRASFSASHLPSLSCSRPLLLACSCMGLRKRPLRI